MNAFFPSLNRGINFAKIRGNKVTDYKEFYDELERICTDRIELTPGGPNFLVNVPAGQWHTVRALESGSVLLECKDGKWEPLGPEDILSL